jgi:3-oxoacyl-[acyl-carrier-protein] synthase I
VKDGILREQPQVAVTGIGIISCLGLDVDAVQNSLRQGRSGIVLDPERQERGFRSGLTGCITGFDPKSYGLSRKQRKSMDQPALFAYAAVHDAVADAGLTVEHLQSDSCGVVFGNDSCVGAAAETLSTLERDGETRYVGSGQIFKTMNSTATMNIGTLLGLRGANWTLSAACSSGAHAVGQGLMLIRSGLQEIVIVGGTQEINWPSMASFDAIGAFSLRQDQPQQASRPFDKNRDGLVPGGGGACLILENLESARQRGAPIHAVVRGYGFSSDGMHLSVPGGDGAQRAITNALADAGITPEQIDYVNAHATSTPRGDLVEAQAIAKVFGTQVPVSSTKSMTGHECWMGGASELIYCILMAGGGFIAPNINYRDPDPQCPGINIVAQTLEKRLRLILSNSFGFGGTNAAIVLDFENAATGGS